MDMFLDIFSCYDYVVHIFISMIFHKQYKHILGYLSAPLLSTEYYPVGIT